MFLAGNRGKKAILQAPHHTHITNVPETRMSPSFTCMTSCRRCMTPLHKRLILRGNIRQNCHTRRGACFPISIYEKKAVPNPLPMARVMGTASIFSG